MKPSISAEQYRLAERITEIAPENATIWCWWDFGYFLHYVTRLPVVAHGGTMEPDFLLMDATPLAESNPAVSANWMRFIAEQEVFGFRFVQERLHSMDLSMDFLRQVFARPQDLESILNNYGIAEPLGLEWWRGYLFPKTTVLLYLDPTMLHKVTRWFDLGSWDFEKGKGASVDFYHIPNPGEWVSEEHLTVLHDFGDGAIFPISYKETCLLDEKGLHCTQVQQGNHGSVIRIEGAGDAFFLGQQIRQSLVARLLLLEPWTTPGFEAIYCNPLEGGWWLVKPLLHGNAVTATSKSPAP